MKLAVIPMFGRRTQDIALYAGTSDYHMALTHLALQSKAYKDYYKERAAKGDFVILDNSIIELGASMDWGTVVDVAEAIQPSEVVLPDVLLDGPSTMEAIGTALMSKHTTRLKPGTRLMAVCHGATSEEWLHTFTQLSMLEQIHTIGIPKVTAELFGSRNALLTLLEESGMLDSCGKGIHLLGANEDKDFQVPARAKRHIRGIDTVYPMWMAHNNILLEPIVGMNPVRPYGKIVHEDMTVLHPIKAMTNIGVCLSWSHE